MENYAVIVAPLHTVEYEEAMKRCTVLQAEGFVVTQRNVIILRDQKLQVDNPYCIFWMERSVKKEEQNAEINNNILAASGVPYSNPG